MTSEALSPGLRDALVAKLTALADDELLLAHRNSEWIGHAPILEEDIALANVAQDELGHAHLWLNLRAELDGSDPDALAFRRDPRDFRSARLVELPRGDWAFTLVRQFLFDVYEAVWLGAAQHSAHTPLREVAAKMLREERFHVQHTKLWAERLGLGTEESNRRAQAALDVLWPLTAQLFAPIPGEADLVAAGIVPDLAPLRAAWEGLVAPHLRASGLRVPDAPAPALDRAEVGEDRVALLREMQTVARADEAAAVW